MDYTNTTSTNSKETSCIQKIGKSVASLLLSVSLGFSVPAFATELDLEWGTGDQIRGWHDLAKNNQGPFGIFTSDIFAQEEPVPLEVLVSPLSGGPAVTLPGVFYIGTVEETIDNWDTGVDDVGYYHTYLVNINPFCTSQPGYEIFQVRFRVFGARNVSERRLMTCGGV